MLLQCYRDLAPSIIASDTASIASDAAPSSTPAHKFEQADEAGASATPPAKPKPRALTLERLGRKTPHAGIYVPRIYGFRVSEFAASGPRMQWMRERPHSLAELEQA